MGLNQFLLGPYLHPDLQDAHQQPVGQMGFKKGIKREIAAYPSLKDERYFDGFKRSLLIVAKTHECNEVLDLNYTTGSENEEQELLRPNKPSCSVSSIKLTWARPLSGDTWLILMLNQYGKSSVST